jgi:hypothetical protein
VIRLLSWPLGENLLGRSSDKEDLVVWSPQVRRLPRGAGGERWVVGHWLVDEFLEFAASRARPNTMRAYAHDLKTFFGVVGKDPLEVRSADVMAFVTAQRRPRPGAEKVVRICDGGSGLSTATYPSTLGRGFGVAWVSGHPR